MPRGLIDRAINTLIQEDTILFHHGLYEQNLVGRLSYHLQTLAIEDNDLSKYYADVEYNRAVHGGLKVIPGNNIQGEKRVFVDLVLHGRGLNGARENIICCEMKKRTRQKAWETHRQAAEDILQVQLIADDQEKLRAFTANGNPYNEDGNVIGYEIGVLIVPRYDPEGMHAGLASRIKEIFVRYYAEGEALEEQDRIIEVTFHIMPV